MKPRPPVAMEQNGAISEVEFEATTPTTNKSTAAATGAAQSFQPEGGVAHPYPHPARQILSRKQTRNPKGGASMRKMVFQVAWFRHVCFGEGTLPLCT